MKSSRTLLSRASRRTIVGVAAVLSLTFASAARADMPEGKLTQDTTVGANHDVVLKAGYVVQIMKQGGTSTVIMVPLPDGSNGIFQIDSGTIQAVPAGTPLGLPAPPPPPPPPGTVAPSYPLGCIGTPTFQTTAGNHASGLANLLIYQPGDAGYIVTVRHLLEPLGGFATQILAKDMPGAVQVIQIADYTGASTDYAVTGLVVQKTHPRAEGGSPADDLAIFQLHVASTHAQQVTLSDQLPAVGDPVWLIARLHNQPPDQIAHRAVVTANQSWLEVVFDESDIHPGSANGAPVLDKNGHVVGVFARSINAAGQIRGYVIPSTLIVKTIQAQPH